jgi:DNA-binding NarL/FixJ family response regulator
MAITVLLVEDHALVRDALRALLNENDRIEVVGQAADGREALALAEQTLPQVVIMDIMMPNLNGFEATARLREMQPAPSVIILSQHQNEAYVVQALSSGASAYLLKDDAPDELPAAIDAVLAGRIYLSARLPREAIETQLRRGDNAESPIERLSGREREVLQLVVEGNTNKQVAYKLGISIKTVEKHRFSVMDKLNIRDVTGLVRFAIANGIIEDPGHLNDVR